jgi:hypothetical protein
MRPSLDHVALVGDKQGRVVYCLATVSVARFMVLRYALTS